MKPEWEARFWSKVDVRGTDECWPWKAGRRKGKYGGFKVGQRSYLAHRVAFYLHHGRWPRLCLHTCDNPPCCNPFHLRSGYQRRNMREAALRERRRSKLTREQVAEIRGSNRTGRALAALYGVSPALISMIRTGKARTV